MEKKSNYMQNSNSSPKDLSNQSPDEKKGTNKDYKKNGYESKKHHKKQNDEDLNLDEIIQDSKEDEAKEQTENPPYQVIDVSNFFNYQKAISSLMDYLNLSIDDTIAGFTRSDQLLFTHPKKKMIMNSILESGFYDFCKYRLALVAKSSAMESKEKFADVMNKVQGEIDLLAYLLVNTRIAHRNLNFDLFLSLLKGGLFIDILETHEKIVKNLHEQEKSVNRKNIKNNVKVTSDQFYI